MWKVAFHTFSKQHPFDFSIFEKPTRLSSNVREFICILQPKELQVHTLLLVQLFFLQIYC